MCGAPKIEQRIPMSKQEPWILAGMISTIQDQDLPEDDVVVSEDIFDEVHVTKYGAASIHWKLRKVCAWFRMNPSYIAQIPRNTTLFSICQFLVTWSKFRNSKNTYAWILKAKGCVCLSPVVWRTLLYQAFTVHMLGIWPWTGQYRMTYIELQMEFFIS